MKEVNINTSGDIDKAVKEKSIIREIFEWVVCIVVAFVIALVVRYFIFTPTVVKQVSMEPTILDSERVIINRLVRTFRFPLNRGDIITFEEPLSTVDGVGTYEKIDGPWEFFVHNVLEVGKRSYIKRVIGVANDHVQIKNGNVYVNDQKVNASYLPKGTKTELTGEFGDVIVPEGYVYVLGDHRDNSTDSRVFGCIPIEKVEGRVTTRIWPFSKFGKIDK